MGGSNKVEDSEWVKEGVSEVGGGIIEEVLLVVVGGVELGLGFIIILGVGMRCIDLRDWGEWDKWRLGFMVN